MKKNINVLLTTTANQYLKYVAVAIESIYNHKKVGYNYNIYIFILGDISHSDKSKFDKYTGTDFSINFIKIDEKYFFSYNNMTKKQYSYCARLLLDKYLSGIDKIIYIDSDIVVNGDISELYNLDLSKNIIGACKDCVNRSSNKEKPLPKYFNSGVLLINVKLWNKENIGEKTLNLLNKNHNIFTFPDQDALNYILAGKWRNISPKRNGINIGTFTSNGTQYSASEFKELKSFKICHFAGPLNRPQNLICLHPKRYLYYKYLFKTKYASVKDIFYFISHIFTSNFIVRFAYKVTRFIYFKFFKLKTDAGKHYA